ncbi:signal peptidase I [candidate division WWE3 bacterium]|nr:signal peptidase I [candidate division WWE3 bacterium]
MRSFHGFFSTIFEMIETFAISLVVLVVIYIFVAFPIVVYGASMEPSLHTGERVLVERLMKRFVGFKRGDIVVLHPPRNESIEYVKRVVGLPNEIVKILDCDVYISRDDERFKLKESYLEAGECTLGGDALKEGRAVQLDEDEFLVLGDNRAKSADSRVFGVITADKILGRAVFRFWPLGKIGFL